MFCCFLFFSWYGDRRALPSFPTRRSSDLCESTQRMLGPRSVLPTRVRALLPSIGNAFLIGSIASTRGARAGWAAPASRSEEHTSELQSQSNLVCRLLLEKKKTYKY